MTLPEGDRVDDLLDVRLDGEIESVVWYRSRGSARYALVTSLTDDGRAWLSTVLLDVDDETLRVLDNSMWLPADPEVLDVVTRSVARTCSAAADSLDDADGPLSESLLDLDAETFAGYRLDDDYSPDDSGDWKADEGADEMDVLQERFVEAGVEPADRFIRLAFGGKAPWEGESQRIMRSPDEIGGNFGVEVDEDDSLVLLDVDDMETAPLDEIPETLSVESPHGGVHFYFAVPGWLDHFRDRFSTLNPHPSYGEIRSQDGYVVGPGSELTDCKYPDCCTEQDPGHYLLDDRPVAEIDPEVLGDLVEPYRDGGSA